MVHNFFHNLYMNVSDKLYKLQNKENDAYEDYF